MACRTFLNTGYRLLNLFRSFLPRQSVYPGYTLQLKYNGFRKIFYVVALRDIKDGAARLASRSVLPLTLFNRLNVSALELMRKIKKRDFFPPFFNTRCK